jgi:hypothetical protein
LKWLAATSTAGTLDRQAAAEATFSTESADTGLSLPIIKSAEQPSPPFLGLINQQRWLVNHPVTTHKKPPKFGVFLWGQTFTAAIPDR